ncbi:MAG: Ig-like domain-containing protein, partial [Pseudohongiella sp.]|nr:Ig-like domain-containing protein [Pseudohongiella sp.]
VDQTNPAAPTLTLQADTGASGTDQITSNGQINVSGIETNGTWQFSIDSGANWTTGTGSSFTLAEGTYANGDVLVRQTDLAGNTGANASLGAITVDSTNPAAPTVTALTTNDTTPTLTGTVTLGSGESLSVTVGGATYTTANGLSVTGGNWSVTIPTALAEGTYAVTATVTDTAGNATSDSTTNELVIDTTAPAAPTVTITEDANNDGYINTAELIGVVDVEISLPAGLVAGDVVKVSNGTTTNSITLTGGQITDRKVTTTFASPGDGNTITVTATVTDLAGNVSNQGNDAAKIDTTPPSAPTAVLVNDTGSVGTDAVTKDGTVNVGGIEANATWQYSTNGGTDWTTGTGTSFVLTEGTYTSNNVRVRQTDVAGNNSTSTNMGAMQVDQTKPAELTISLAEDTGINNSDLITSNGQINVSGLEINAGWEYSTDGGGSWTEGKGNSFTLDAGSYADGAVRTRQIDLAGNIGNDVSLGAITIDQTTPVAPTVDSLTTNKSTPTLTGSAVLDANRTLSVDVNGVTYTVANGGLSHNAGSNSWSLTIAESNALADGTYSVTATITDLAGNSIIDSTNDELIVDTTAPAAPNLVLATDTGASTTDAVTNTGLVNVSGIADKSTWEYSTNGGASWTEGTGDSFTLTEAVYADGAVRARQTDAIGNKSAHAVLSAIIVDQTNPLAPVMSLADDTGISATDLITSNGQVNVSGIETTALWEFSTDGGASWTAGTGSSFTLSEGNYASGAIRVRQTDLAGNAGPESALAAVTIDQTNPVIPTVDTLQTNDNTPLLTGSGILDANRTLSVVVNGVTYTVGDGSLNHDAASNSWSLVIPDANSLPDGTYDVTATITDKAGNFTSDDSSNELLVKTTAMPALTASLDVDSGAENDDAVTNVGTINVGGIVADATWEFSTDGGTNWTSGTGSSFTLTEASYPANAVQVRQRDHVGNLSNPTLMSAIVVDQTKPLAPVMSMESDTGISSSDLISSNGQINVSGIESTATWEYSVNGGASWISSNGNNFTLSEGVYADGVIRVRQTDLAGNAGPESSLGPVTIDQTSPVVPSVNPAISDNGTPTITGTGIIDENRTLTVEVDGVTYTVGDGNLTHNSADNTWTLTIPPGNALPDGKYSVTATITDKAGNSTSDTSDEELVLAIEAPSALTLTLATDTGAAATDNVTNTGTILVSGMEDGATWQYSIDGGANWITGEGNSFVLGESDYAADAVRVRQVNIAGVSSVETGLGAVVVDQTNPAAPGLSLSNDTGSSSNDAVTNNSLVTVSGIETNASWEYSTNGGANWNVGSGNSFNLSEGNFAAGSVLARQTDLAGNTGPEASLAAVVIDQTNPVIPVISTTTTSAGAPVITGTAVLGNGETLSVNVGGITYTAGDGNLVYNPNTNTWTLTVPTGNTTGSGTYGVVVAVEDTAGNRSVVNTVVIFEPVPIPQPPAPPPTPPTPTPPVVIAPPPVAPAPTPPPIVTITPPAPVTLTPAPEPAPSNTPVLNANNPTGMGTRPPAVTLAAGATAGGTGTNALLLGIAPTDVTWRADQAINVGIPQGTFLHTDPAASVVLEARLADGSNLPAWIQFDPDNGMFTGQAPEGFTGSVEINVIARDTNGSEATARFAIVISDEQEISAEQLPATTELLPTDGAAPVVEQPANPDQVEPTPEETPAGDTGEQAPEENADAANANNNNNGEPANQQVKQSDNEGGHNGLRQQLLASRPDTLLEHALSLIAALMGDSDTGSQNVPREQVKQNQGDRAA